MQRWTALTSVVSTKGGMAFAVDFFIGPDLFFPVVLCLGLVAFFLWLDG